MPRFKPVRQLRVSEAVTEQLKESIITGHFKPSEKLPSERDLSEQFQVSRVAIREALRKLENSGFIIIRQGVTGGAYVTNLTSEYLVSAFLDLFLADKISIPELRQVRLIVEPEVARLAALNITPEYAQQLKEALDAEELPISSLSEDMERKQKVHIILAEMSGNRILEALVRSLMGLTRRAVEAAEADPRFMHPPGMHRPIVEAVFAGDVEAAVTAMKNHAIEFGDTLIKMEKTYREKNSLSPLYTTTKKKEPANSIAQ
ncbi:MAG: FadR family transcriptional regulator [Deltaproteobacteria bacterium]|nr:FadR family transcriptional regulator [Deltaproteobacteria bacterium]